MNNNGSADLQNSFYGCVRVVVPIAMVVITMTTAGSAAQPEGKERLTSLTSNSISTARISKMHRDNRTKNDVN